MKTFRSHLLLAVLLLSCLAGESQVLINSVKKKYENFRKENSKIRLVTMNDRDIYAPGEVIWFSCYAFEQFEPKLAPSGSHIKLELYNKSNLVLLSKSLPLNNGYASSFLQLPEGLNDGVYYLQSSAREGEEINNYYSKIIVKEKVVPAFIIETNIMNQYFLPGDEVTMQVKFTDFYNEPIKNVEYHVMIYDGEKQVSSLEGKTKKDGLAKLDLQLPANLKSGLCRYRIIATSKNKESVSNGIFPVVDDKIYIDVYPEFGSVVSGIETNVNFYIYNASGQPLRSEIDLMSGDKVLQALETAVDGRGSFRLNPSTDDSYYLRVKAPVLLDKKYELPKVMEKGVSLALTSLIEQECKLRMTSTFENPKLVYLFGMINGKLFWSTDYEVNDQLEASITIPPGESGMAYFVLLDAAEHILSENVFWVAPLQREQATITLGGDEPQEKRAERSVTVSGDHGLNMVTVSVALEPWLVPGANHQLFNSIQLPGDFLSEPLMYGGILSASDFQGLEIAKLAKYYTPKVLSWSKILNKESAFVYHDMDQVVDENMAILDQVSSNTNVQMLSDQIIQSNNLTEQYFYTSNPEYINNLFIKKVKRVPGYKKMLENGTPVLDVLQSIKPFNLQGNNIVFLGGANSINYQGGALIVIDGVQRGTDASLLANISPYEVESIRASSNPNDIQRYTGLNAVGVIEVELIKGTGNQTQTKEPLPDDYEFESPDYSKNKMGGDDDYRSTLYWYSAGPNQSPENIIFFNGDLISDVEGKLFGITSDGSPIQKSIKYQIK